MSFLNGNSIKFLIGILSGAALMFLVDMNDVFQGIPVPTSSSIAGYNFPGAGLRGPENSRVADMLASNTYYNKMKEDSRLVRSSQLQAAFLEAKDYLSVVFERSFRYNTDQGEFATVTLSDQWAFLHVWANGDDDVIPVAVNQLEQFHQPKDSSQSRNRRWMTLVQDPIQHFLNGWALTELKLVEDARENGHEDLAHKIIASWENEHLSYDQRVDQFLERVRRYSLRQATAEMSPLMHALPQTNFMMDEVGSINSNLVMIGDVEEWRAMLELTGFPQPVDESILEPISTMRIKYFPADRNLLSEETLLKLCDFLAMDYFLLGYEGPAACQTKGGPLDFEKRIAGLR